MARPALSALSAAAATARQVAAPRSTLLSIVHPWPDLPLIMTARELHDRVAGNSSTLAIVFALMTGISGSTLLPLALGKSIESDAPAQPADDESVRRVTLPQLAHVLEGVPRLSLREAMLALTGTSFCFTLSGLMCSAMTLAAIHSTPARAAPFFVRRHALLIAVYGWALAPAALSLGAAAAVASEVLVSESPRLSNFSGVPTAVFGIGAVALMVPCASILRANHQMRRQLLQTAAARAQRRHLLQRQAHH
eukprot:a345147_11.p2 GENE.a345147_11~~a345147_11.p2  ORF type:complete len:261 (+),score=58.54 a345147_11:31-783(+)